MLFFTEIPMLNSCGFNKFKMKLSGFIHMSCTDTLKLDMIYIKEKSLYGRGLRVYNLDLIPTFCLFFLPVKQLTQNLESLNPPTFASDY